MLVDLLAAEAQTQVKRTECRSLIGLAEIEGRTVELVKPQTFMNLSGEAINCLLQKPERSVRKLIVISDDLALPLGKLRLRTQGSHGGQNGLRSVIDCLKTNEFIRLRIGIAPEHPVTNASDFVLGKLSKGEAESIEKVLKDAADAIRTVIRDGVDEAMAEFNGELKMEN